MGVVAGLAYALPVQTMCDLLGVPAEKHLDLIGRKRVQLCCFGPGSCPEPQGGDSVRLCEPAR